MTNRLLLSAVLAVGVMITASSAAAESIATGCLAKLTGEVYFLAPYSSGPTKKCRSGDQVVRAALHQPDTLFAKRTASIAENRALKIAVPFHEDLWFMLRSGFEGVVGECELSVDDVESGTAFVVAHVSRGQWQEGMRGKVSYLDEKGGMEPREAERMIRPDIGGAIVFHSLFLGYGSNCTVAFFAEYATSVTQLYAK